MLKQIVLLGIVSLCVGVFAKNAQLKTLPNKTIKMTISVIARSNPMKLRFKIVNNTDKTYQLFEFHDGSGRNEVLLITPSGKQYPLSNRDDCVYDPNDLKFSRHDKRIYNSTVDEFLLRLREKNLKMEKGDYKLIWKVVLGNKNEDVFQAPPFIFTIE